MDNITLDAVSSGAIDPEQHNQQSENVNNDAAQNVKKESVDKVIEAAQIASDSVQAIADALLTPDGQLKDLSDAKGRKAIANLIAQNNSKMNNLYNALASTPSEVAKVIPSHVEARLCDSDRKLVEKFFARVNHQYVIEVVIGFFFAAFLVLDLALFGKVYNDRDELEKQQEAQKEMIDFGTTVKRISPEVYDTWYREIRPRENKTKK